METETLNQIETLAKTVEAQHVALVSAIAEENKADALLLEAVIAKLGGALPALCSRPKIEYRCTGLATDSQRESSKRAAWRGMCVSDKWPGAIEDNPRSNSGAYEGTDLFIRDDGSFVELEYTGSWSRWQGSISAWESSERELTIQEVASEYEINPIVGHILRHLSEYANGNASKRAAQARERAEKIGALLHLLK